MAKSKQQLLEESLAAAMQAAADLGEGTVQRITVDGTATGRYPYQIAIADAEFPVVGLADSPDANTDPGAASSSPKQGNLGRS